MKVIKEQIEGDHKSIFESLNQLKSWLSRNDGLGLQSIIDNILDEIKTNIGEDDIEKYIMIYYNYFLNNSFDFTNIASVIKNEYFEPNNKSLNFNNIFSN